MSPFELPAAVVDPTLLALENMPTRVADEPLVLLGEFLSRCRRLLLFDTFGSIQSSSSSSWIISEN